MIDLDDRINRVYNPDARPLVQEAHRCYASGAARGAIVLTWTAVCADLITKAQILHEDGEAAARSLVEDVDRAQTSPAPEAAMIMSGVERSVLDTAEQLELIDFTQKRQLDRLREDRHLCAHPSARPSGELYEPTMEYARAHLAAALEAVLIHPPSQGRKVWKSFAGHVADPAFIFNPDYLRHVYFDRVRPSVRAKVVEFAAKFAVLQLDDPDVSIAPAELADRMAQCLRCFAERDTELATKAVAKTIEGLEKTTPAVQLAALGRLGDLSAFWACVPDPLRSQFNALVEQLGKAVRPGPLEPDEARALSLVTSAELRETLPALAGAFTSLQDARHRADVVGVRPDPYYAPHLADLLAGAWSYDIGEYVAYAAVLPCATYLTLEQLGQVTQAWNSNAQCWGRAMPDYLVDLYTATAHLGPERDHQWEMLMTGLENDPRGVAISRGTGVPLPGPPDAPEG